MILREALTRTRGPGKAPGRAAGRQGCFPTFPHAREACSHNEQVDSGEARVFLVLKQQGVGCVEAGFFRARGVPSSRRPAVGRTERQPVCPFGRRVGMRCPDRHRCCQYFISTREEDTILTGTSCSFLQAYCWDGIHGKRESLPGLWMTFRF